MKKTLNEIAAFLNGQVVGDGQVIIEHVRGIDEDGVGDLTFISNPKYLKKMETSRASAIIFSSPLAAEARGQKAAPAGAKGLPIGVRTVAWVGSAAGKATHPGAGGPCRDARRGVGHDGPRRRAGPAPTAEEAAAGGADGGGAGAGNGSQ